MDERRAEAVTHWKAWFGRHDAVAARLLPDVARWEWSTGSRHNSIFRP
jgi:hypothetical protein